MINKISEEQLFPKKNYSCLGDVEAFVFRNNMEIVHLRKERLQCMSRDHENTRTE